MKKEKISEILDGIDERYITEAAEVKKAGRPLLKVGAAAACLALAVTAAAVMLPVMNNSEAGVYTESEETTEAIIEHVTDTDTADTVPEITDTEAVSAEITEPATESESTAYTELITSPVATEPAETTDKEITAPPLSPVRPYKDGVISEGESAVIWTWDVMTAVERYRSFTMDGSEYTTRASEICKDKLGKALGKFEFTGYDIYTDTTHKISLDYYAIQGILSECAVAVQFENDDSYYVYVDSWYRPETLEELGDKAFYQCEALERAIFHCPPTVLGDKVFYYDHRYEGQNGSAATVQVEVLPKITVYYSRLGQWETVEDPAGLYWEYAPKQVYLDVARESWYADAVDYASGHALMNGVGGGRFSPDATMTRAMVVTVLWRLQGSPTAERTHSFGDVEDSAWYAQAVNWAFAHGIANGVNNSRFNPDGSITREQLAAFLYRYASYCDPDLADHGALPNFPDKGTVSSYAEEALIWACGEGFINGIKDGAMTYLRPKSSATRAQVAAILMRYMEKESQ